METNKEHLEAARVRADKVITDAVKVQDEKEAEYHRDLEELYALDMTEYQKQTHLLKQIGRTVGRVMVDIKAEVHLDDDAEYEVRTILEEIF